MEKRLTRSALQNPRFEPVFVLGEFHSGATLISRVLTKYFEMNWAPLNELAVQYNNQLDLYGDLTYDCNLTRLIEDILCHPRLVSLKKHFSLKIGVEQVFKRVKQRDLQSVLRAIFESFPFPERWVDKVHHCQDSTEILKELFPTARFIHIVRDGRDIALANLRLPNNVKNWALSAMKWKHCLNAIDQFSRTLAPGRFIEIRYEDLLSAPQIVLERLRTFLGISGAEGKLRDLTARYIQDDLPLDFPAMWKQQLPSRDVLTFEKVAAEHLSQYGYETISIKPAIHLPVSGESEVIPQLYAAGETQIFATQ